MAAASNNSPGIDLKNPVRRKIVIGRENVIYGIIRPTLELVNPIPAKRTNSGIRIQCTAALIAFLTILITTVNFVVSVEVNFYPKYRNYYSLFNDGGTIKDIMQAGTEMLDVLNRELKYTALKQLLTTALAISVGESLLKYLPLGFNDLMYGYFRQRKHCL